MTSIFRFGEIFVCRFPFTSGELSKPRPVLLLFDVGSDAVICRITSVEHHGPLDIPVLAWREAGLEKPSTIRLSRLVTVEKSLLTRLIGKLAETDAAPVKAAWNQQMLLQ